MFINGCYTISMEWCIDYCNNQTIPFSFADSEKPVFLSCPLNVTTNLTSTRAEKMVTWQPPNVSDNSGFYNLSSSHSSGDLFPVGDTEVHYIATDQSSNAASCGFTVKVVGKFW